MIKRLISSQILFAWRTGFIDRNWNANYNVKDTHILNFLSALRINELSYSKRGLLLQYVELAATLLIHVHSYFIIGKNVS